MSAYQMKVIAGFAAISCVLALCFYAGYRKAEDTYTKIIDAANQKAELLSEKEIVIEKEIVTVYKDRVQTVTKVEEKIIEVTKDVLQEESANCAIGPGFIGLHNQAANQTLPSSTSGTDEVSRETTSTQ